MNNDEYTTSELIKIVKNSDGSDEFISLLQRIVAQVSDTRIKLANTENDTLELRQGIAKVIDEMIIKPLSSTRKPKERIENNEYN